MDGLDEGVLLILNRLAQASWSFDTVMQFASGSYLLKGGAIAAVLWWLWFRDGPHAEAGRSHIIATLLASLVAIAVARVLALTLPFRVRPLHDEELAFVLPHGTPETRLEAWSAMPSDHAVLFFTLAAGIWFVSRTVGLVVTIYVTLVIALPRIYLGLHYPSDMVVGALIGVTIATAANAQMVRSRITGPALRWVRASPGSFHAVFFLLTFQIAMLFEGVRDLAGLIRDLIEARL